MSPNESCIIRRPEDPWTPLAARDRADVTLSGVPEPPGRLRVIVDVDAGLQSQSELEDAEDRCLQVSVCHSLWADSASKHAVDRGPKRGIA